MYLKEDIYVTKGNGEIAKFYDPNKNKWVNQVMVCKGTPCEIVDILGHGMVRIKCRNINGKLIEGDEHMDKIKFEDKRITV
jgi:hypothetical protein